MNLFSIHFRRGGVLRTWESWVTGTSWRCLWRASRGRCARQALLAHTPLMEELTRVHKKTLPLGERREETGDSAKGVKNTFVLYNILAFLLSQGMQIPHSCSPQGTSDSGRWRVCILRSKLFIDGG